MTNIKKRPYHGLINFLIVLTVLVLTNHLQAKSIKKKDRQLAQVQGVIVLLDINQAHEELNSLQKIYTQHEVIQVPSIQRLSRPALAGLILRRNGAEGARFWACRTVHDGLCAYATEQASKLNQELAATGWNLDAEINFQLGLIKSEVNAVYVSGHYNLAKDSFGSIIGKWGRTELKTFSSLLENKPIFKSTKFVALLSCYFGKAEFIDTILPIVINRRMIVVGFKGTAPLSSDPTVENFLNIFSKIDLNFSRSHEFPSNFKKQKELLTKLVGPSVGSRRLSLHWSDGQGNIFDIETPDSQKTSRQKLQSDCTDRMNIIKPWFIELVKSMTCRSSEKGVNPSVTCANFSDLAETYTKIKNELSGVCFNLAIQEFMAQKAYFIFKQVIDTNDLNSTLGLRGNSEKTKSRVTKIFADKAQRSLSLLNEDFLSLENELVAEFNQSLADDPTYDSLRTITSDFLLVQSAREFLGFTEPEPDHLTHKDIRVGNQMIYLKTRYYLKQKSARIEFLKSKLEEIQKSDAKMNRFIEFGSDHHFIKYNIQQEIESLNQVGADF